MVNFEQDRRANPDGVNLLVSILVCYPEIATLRFEPADDTLKMTFVLSGVPARKAFEDASDFIKRSLLTYHALEYRNDAIVEFKLDSCGELAFIHVIRDVGTLSRGEIALLSTLMRDRFSEQLVRDLNVTTLEEEGVIQEELIDSMIGNVKLSRVVERLIGIREDGRVMVFNK